MVCAINWILGHQHLDIGAGADVLVAGSAVFKGGCVDRPEVYGGNIAAIRKAAETARVGVKPAA